MAKEIRFIKITEAGNQVGALTAQGVTSVEIVKAIAAAGLKITPDIQVSSNGGNDNGLIQVLLADMMHKRSIGM